MLKLDKSKDSIVEQPSNKFSIETTFDVSKQLKSNDIKLLHSLNINFIEVTNNVL